MVATLPESPSCRPVQRDRPCSRPGRGVSCLIVPFLMLALAAPLYGQDGAPGGPVPVETLRTRRAALFDAIGDGVMILRSATTRSIEGDYPQDSDYREKNDFFYLTGLEAPDAWLVMDARRAERDVILWLTDRDPARERWTGARLGPGSVATALTGIADTRSAKAAASDIRGLIGSDGAARVLAEFAAGAAPACGGIEAPCVPAFAELGIKPSDRLEDAAPLLAALRLVKDADEIRRLRRAIDITAEAQRAAMAFARPGVHEYEIEAVIEYTFRRNGAERVGFPSIIGSGPNSVMLHYDRSRRRTEPGDLVVIDVGAEFGYYSADVTRTIPVSGRFSDRQRALYDLVLGTQQAALDAVRPGITMAELNRIARQFMERNSGDLCGPASCVRYFVHGLSHWLGMDVHDVGDYETPLQAGMVFTIEPGVYIAEENLGIRIEDDVLVTAMGYELLSAGAPREAAAIEGLMENRDRGRAPDAEPRTGRE